MLDYINPTSLLYKYIFNIEFQKMEIYLLAENILTDTIKIYFMININHSCYVRLYYLFTLSIN